jgi:hypothetical protein
MPPTGPFNAWPPPEPFPPSPPFPFPPRTAPALLQAPVVYVAPVWEYRELVRALDPGTMPTENDLNELGAEGWELVSVVSENERAHFYFKRLRE